MVFSLVLKEIACVIGRAVRGRNQSKRNGLRPISDVAGRLHSPLWATTAITQWVQLVVK